MDEIDLHAFVNTAPPRDPAVARLAARAGARIHRLALYLTAGAVAFVAVCPWIDGRRTGEEVLSSLICGGSGLVLFVLPVWLLARAGMRRIETTLRDGAVVPGTSVRSGTMLSGATAVHASTVFFVAPDGTRRKASISTAGWRGAEGGVSVVLHPRWPSNALVVTNVRGEPIVDANVRKA